MIGSTSHSSTKNISPLLAQKNISDPCYTYTYTYNYKYIMPNRTIYIHQHVDEKLRQEESMSGLINQLLMKHYAITKPGIVMPTVEKQKKIQPSMSYTQMPVQPMVIEPDWGA